MRDPLRRLEHELAGLRDVGTGPLDQLVELPALAIARRFLGVALRRNLGALLISNPCNPTGVSIAGEELRGWVELSRVLIRAAAIPIICPRLWILGFANSAH